MFNGKQIHKSNSVFEIKKMNTTINISHIKDTLSNKESQNCNVNNFRNAFLKKIIKRELSDRNIYSKGCLDYFASTSQHKTSLRKRFDSSKRNSMKNICNEMKMNNSTYANYMEKNDFKELSEYYQEGHLLDKRNIMLNEQPSGLIYKSDKQAKIALLKKYDLLPIVSLKEKKVHDMANHSFGKVTYDAPQYYKDQFDSYQLINTNKSLHDHLLLKTNKEQIKAFLFKQKEIEELKSKMSLMPEIKQISLQTKNKKIDYTKSLKSMKMLQNLSEVGSILRKNLFVLYNKLYISNISKYNCTPTSRSDSKMINYYSDKTYEHKLYIYGGMNIKRLDEIWECSINDKSYNKYQWKKIIPQGEKQLSRSGHSLCYHKNELVIYGGIVESNSIKEDILFYSFEHNSFFPENCSNKTNLAWRKYHIAEIISTHMLIHGGVDEAGHILNDSWALDLTKRKWIPVKINCNFFLPYLHSHSSCQVFSHYKFEHPKFSLFKMFTEKNDFARSSIALEGIYIFGGIDSDGLCSNNLYVINGKPLTLYKIDAKGTPPSPRCSFTMNFFDRLNVLIIHGGKNERDSSGPYFNDFYFLDLQLVHWYRMETNDKVEYRGGHCSTINENELIIFGGINDKHFLKSDLLIINLDIIENYHLIKKYKKKRRKNCRMI